MSELVSLSGKGIADVRIAMDAARTADIDHHARLLVLYTEIRRRGTHQSEWRCIVHC